MISIGLFDENVLAIAHEILKYQHTTKYRMCGKVFDNFAEIIYLNTLRNIFLLIVLINRWPNNI